MTRVVLLMVLAVRQLAGQGAACSDSDLSNVWRLNVIITDATPQLGSISTFDTVVNNFYGDVGITKTGDLLPGIMERNAIVTEGVILGPPPSYAYTCTLPLKVYSLLENNGTPMGYRITRYALTVDPSTGNVIGNVQYESHDMTGAIFSVANGAVTGASIADQVGIKGDPFWNSYGQVHGSIRQSEAKRPLGRPTR